LTLRSTYHIGVLVADLEEAIEHFSAVLGVTFNPPTVLRARGVGPAPTDPFDLRVTYSREGPPHYELIEANSQSIYSIVQGEGLHHTGVWSPNVRLEIDRLASLGVHPEFELADPSGGAATAWYSDPHDSHGVRFEFVDESVRAHAELLITGGPTE
jgi:catechol 2,3-dioxygenase-like lactoylglutathione lyase family enzyme